MSTSILIRHFVSVPISTCIARDNVRSGSESNQLSMYVHTVMS